MTGSGGGGEGGSFYPIRMKQQIPEGGNRVSANFLFKDNEMYVIILRYYRNVSIHVCMYVRT